MFVLLSFFDWTMGSHTFSCSHDFINQQQLLGKGWSDVKPVLLGAEVVIDLFLHWGNNIQCIHVQTHCHFLLEVFILQKDDGFLDIISTVFSQDLSYFNSTFGMTSKASAKAWIPSLAFPSTFFPYSVKWTLAAISKDPAPGTTDLSS